MEISLPWEGDGSLKSPSLDKETGGQKRLVHEGQSGEIRTGYGHNLNFQKVKFLMDYTFS